jgi:hypothetical protein
MQRNPFYSDQTKYVELFLIVKCNLQMWMTKIFPMDMIDTYDAYETLNVWIRSTVYAYVVKHPFFHIKRKGLMKRIYLYLNQKLKCDAS